MGVGYDAAIAADNRDLLAAYRDEFVIADEDLIYLDGNSLGRLPRATKQHVDDVVATGWGANLIASWADRWWTLSRSIGDLIAPLIGAAEGSVVVADSTSVGLFKLAWAALQLRNDRSRIVTDNLNFPTDLYILDAAGRAAGGRLIDVVHARDRVLAPEDDLIAALDEETALLSLSHVSFKSGYLYDMERLTRAAHEVGALVLWDLSHSAGVVPMDLSSVDLAVGCTYKYLNGGPGSPAFIYVNPAHDIENPLTGWWGHANPFAFDTGYKASDDISRFQTGTMPILSLAAIEPAVRIAGKAGIDTIRTKSGAQTSYLIELADLMLAPYGFEVVSPRDGTQRGSHVSLRHDDAWRIAQAMIHDGQVVPDFREPDNVRLGIAPLYTRHLDIHTAVHRIALLMEGNFRARYPDTRSDVT
ncbi:MAG: kynureninase [bacterium]|nr:kynureninase [bacterium]